MRGGAKGVVFVHGGKHDGRCWGPTMEVIRARAPGLAQLAVDLPGRRGTSGDTTPGLTRAPADRSALALQIPRTWVLTLRDRTLPPRVQLRFAANLAVSESSRSIPGTIR
jgi:pimeloyl-ACP methyl ester carboxylesterase